MILHSILSGNYEKILMILKMRHKIDETNIVIETRTRVTLCPIFIYLNLTEINTPIAHTGQKYNGPEYRYK